MTLDLASGYWQIRLSRNSCEKTVFSVPQGLFEFRVMPFGLTNASAVFQRLMEKVLSGLNHVEGPDIVKVYIDDVIVFSPTLTTHLDHLCQVFNRIRETGLKLTPKKCKFHYHEGGVFGPRGLEDQPRNCNSLSRISEA